MISFIFWLKRQKNLLSRPRRSKQGWDARPRRVRLGLEVLETRLAPAVTATLAVSKRSRFSPENSRYSHYNSSL